MTNKEIWSAIEKEMIRAKKKFPTWPVHICSKASIVSEEAGEVTRACLKYKYERSKDKDGKAKQIQDMRDEAVQVAVTAIRFLENLK